MPLNNQQTKILHELGFRFRSKRRYSLTTKYGQFFAVNIFEEGCLFEIDGQIMKSKPLSFEEVIEITKILYPNEQRKRIRKAN